MRRFVTSLLGLVLALTLLAGAPAADAGRGDAPAHYTPKTMAKFNRPVGGERSKLVLYRHVLRAINSTPRGATIRAAVFSFAEKETSRALLAAARRGVRVKLVFDRDRQFPTVKNLVRVLGTDTRKRSYVVLCDDSCRGSRGQMHAKFFSFTRVGDARYVTMVGSNNITRFNSDEQWSDVYTVAGDRAYFGVFKRWFGQLRRDTPLADPYAQTKVGGNTVTFTPVDLAVHPDPVLAALAPVGCQTATGAPTRVLIAAHAWNGERGKTIARRVAGLVRDGCAVRVVLGVGTGAAVRAILEGPGTAMTSGTHPGIYTHEKLLIVSGRYGATDTTRVWTGSHNWSDRALGRDDIIVGITDPTVGAQYVAAFDTMWALG